MLAKWSIRSKIIGVIAFLLFVMGGLGAMAVRSMQGINANTVEIATNWLPSVRASAPYAPMSTPIEYRFVTIC